MRIRFLSVLMALSLPLWAASAFAQDTPPEEGSPETGDMGADPAAGDMGGDPAATEGGAELSADDAGGGGPAKPISVGLLLGYGISLESGSFNPWGLGFGARGGYNLDQIFLGARFVFYLGEQDFNIWEFGIEGGYDIDAGGVTIRPGLGLGLANASGPDIPATAFTPAMSSPSSTDLYIAPGASLLFDVSDSIFVGADVRLQLILADPDMVKALILLANAGMRF